MDNKDRTYKMGGLFKIRRRWLPAVLGVAVAGLAIGVPAFLAAYPFGAKAAQTDVAVMIDGVKQSFTVTPRLDAATNTPLVPAEEMFGKLGIDLSYNPDTKAYLGGHARSSLLITLGSDTAYYDAAPIALGAKAEMADGVMMVDVGLIDYLYGMTVTESADRTQVEIATGGVYDVFDNDDNYAKQIDGLGGTDILRQPSATGSNHGSVYFSPSSSCANSEITVAGQAFTNAIQNESFVKNMSAAHACQLQYKLNAAVTAGDVLMIQFTARTTKTDDVYGNAHARLGIAKADGSNSLSLHNDVATITADWQTFYVPFDTAALAAPLGANDRLHFHTAYGNQTIQVGDVKLVNLGKSVKFSDVEKRFYRGQSLGAAWRKAAEKRIEKHRVSPINVAVKDDNGNAIAGAEVEVKMKQREFTFGVALNTQDLANDATYRANIPPFFDLIEPENALKWTYYESDVCRGRAGADYFYQYAMDNGYAMRGHNLIWDEPAHYPAYKDYNAAAGCTKNQPIDWKTISETDAANLISAHIKEIVAKYPNLTEWDVWNEPTAEDKRLLRNRFGEKFFTQFFELVEETNPNIKKYINDFYLTGNHDQGEDELIALIQKLTADGAKVDGLGVQTHVTGRAYPQDIYNQIASVGRYVDEVAVTEYDIRSSDEALGADYLRDTLILAYSNPKMKKFINWLYKDKADGSRSRLVRSDYTKKPAYFAMENLIKDWTTETKGATNNAGAYTASAHHGVYEITVKYGNKSKTVTYDTAEKLAAVEVVLESDKPAAGCGGTAHEPVPARDDKGDVLRVPSEARTVKEINAWINQRAKGTVLFTNDLAVDETIAVYGAKEITFASEGRVAVLTRGAGFSGTMINGNSSSAMTLENVIIDGAETTSPVKGQGVYTTGSLVLKRVTVRRNHSSSYGAGLMMNGQGKLEMSDSFVCDNTAAGKSSGGGVRLSGSAAAVIMNSQIAGNKASSGAGISAGEQSGLDLVGTSVRDNAAADIGGGALATDTAGLKIAGGVMTGNTAGAGDAMYVSSNNVALKGNIVIGKTQEDNGIYLSGANTLKVTGDLAAGAKVNIEKVGLTSHGKIVAEKQDENGAALEATAAEAGLFYYQQTSSPLTAIVAHKTNYILSEPTYHSIGVEAMSAVVAPDRISSMRHTVKTESNYHDGYILSFSTATTDNTLHNHTSSVAIPSVSSATPVNLHTNKSAWGYRMDNFGEFGSGPTEIENSVKSSAFTWAAVPKSSSPVTLHRTFAPETGYRHDLQLYYAIAAAKDIPEGIYTNEIVYTLTPQI